MYAPDSFISQLRQFFPPDLSPSYLRAEMPAIWQTVELAAGGMLFALSIGLLLALIIGARLPGWRLLYAALVAVRSIPDLTLAILCVVIVGIGPGAGLLAITIYYGAAMGKVGGDLFASADRGPVESLTATGATRFTVAFYGQLPLRFKDMLTYGAYDFECAMRAAMIVGAVGAGGIGTELLGAINALEYQRVTTLVILLVVLIAIFDKVAWLTRKYPRLLIAFAALGAYSAWDLKPGMFAFSHTLQVLQRMWPPKLSLEQIHGIPQLLGETLLMAVGGTIIAMLLALPLGAAAARNLAPAWIREPVRRVLEILRAIPEVVWGLIFVSAATMGLQAGIAALALHSTGVLGKLYSESLENVQPEPVMSLAATGAPGIAVAAFAHFPLAFPPIAIQTLFRFEWNIRAAAVVGMIGAGGIGQALYNAQQLFFYDQMFAYLLITCVIVTLVDLANSHLRHHWKVTEGRI